MNEPLKKEFIERLKQHNCKITWVEKNIQGDVENCDYDVVDEKHYCCKTRSPEGISKDLTKKDYIVGTCSVCRVINNLIKKHISAVEWYRKWLGNPLSFYKEHPEYEEELDILWEKSKSKTILGKPMSNMIWMFNKWLLDKAFEDVIE